MTHLSEHDLWTMGANRVATMAPGPGDLFVTTLVNGKRVFVEPIDRYERAVRIAEGFARRIRPERPVTIRVLPMTPTELLAHMGTTPEQMSDAASASDVEADRQLVIDTCMTALRECDDPAVRASSMEVLTQVGALS